MKTKQAKEDHEKTDEETVIEPKTRARKKASDIVGEEKARTSQDDPKPSKETKKVVAKSRAIVKKRPLGIRKVLRSKKAVIVKEKVKKVIKQTRGRKPAAKPEVGNAQESSILIPPSEIKKEPVDDSTPNSRSSSPKTGGRRQRLSSDMVMMKTVLGDSTGSLVLGPRTSPYSMRSERSNSPSIADGINLRSGKPRKVKNNLLNEVVMKEQKKRRRLLSDSKVSDMTEGQDCKKVKRGRSCSREGSEISKCSDNTESDISLSEPFNDSDSKELKKLDKSKTDLDVDIENNVQLSSFEKVPSVSDKIAETKSESSYVNENNKKKLSFKRSTSLDSDNNNSNRVKLDNSVSTASIDESFLLKTENDTLLEDRSSILTSMSKKFNTKEITKNIKRARRGRKAAAANRPDPNKNCLSTATVDTADDKHETLSKEIDDLINNLGKNIDHDHEISNSSSFSNTTISTESKLDSIIEASKINIVGDENVAPIQETPLKDRQAISSMTNENTPSKIDDSDSIRLHYEEDSTDKTDGNKHEITFKCMPVASIDKLMDRLKEFEEFDKRRQRQESESKSNESKPMMVTSDVVLIPKSGADINLKDIQTVRSPERPIEKENVLSCFENNSAISIVKRDQVRKSVDIDLPNSVTLYKRNSVSARKESTSSNHSRESDAISIFEKSLGKDVTLTELRKSVDKSATPQVDLHHLASLQSSNSTPNIVGTLDSSQISIMPRVTDSRLNNSAILIIGKRKSRESLSRKSSESNNETDEKLVIIEKIMSPPHQPVSPAVSITPAPIAIKSPESTIKEVEALPPPIEPIKPQETSLNVEVPKDYCNKTTSTDKAQTNKLDTPVVSPSIIPDSQEEVEMKLEENNEVISNKQVESGPNTANKEIICVSNKEINENILTSDLTVNEIHNDINKKEVVEEKKLGVMEVGKMEVLNEQKQQEADIKSEKVPKSKSARNSIECQAGSSNMLNETPESKKRKEYVLRTLGLLTHKAAKEAKIEKLKEKERIKNKAAKSGSGDYTGTLKTVIKLNRSAGDREKKKQRSSLKMTFQKSKYRAGKPTPEVGETAAEEESYYTIERREGAAGATSEGGQRKSHYSNRLNHGTTHNAHIKTEKSQADEILHTPNPRAETEAVPEPVESKDTPNLVIPEKASSFSIHPGRLCMDQCFYCGGKFGLFDTPCHIAQIKSSERQKKILANEEKLTIDSCLCDACYRHVDRRANCPSYRKRPLGKQPDVPMLPSPPYNMGQSEKAISPPLEEESEEEPPTLVVSTGRAAVCHTEGCTVLADHSIRRKWLIKMRTSVNKLLKLKNDYPGLHTIPLCADHHRVLSPLMACGVCRRRITKHHNVHFIQHGYIELNPLLLAEGVPVQFQERPVLCKACRDYCTLLQRPNTNDAFVRMHRRKILRIYNIEVPPGSDPEIDETVSQDDNNPNKKKKQRAKSKRKSIEPEKDSESSEITNDSTPEKEKTQEEEQHTHIEEDIESLISSNKILVPTAKTNENMSNESSEAEIVCEVDANFIHIDKQTELQYLLQKQNNPAQFMNKQNLNHKQRNILKLQTVSGIQKPGQQHRIQDKNAKKIHKIGGQMIKERRKEDIQIEIEEGPCDGIPVMKNITLNDECTIESIPTKRPADINTLKNKWQMSESFTQVKRNLSELSKKLDKDPKKLGDPKYSNPVKRLETNPSISVRELFPGEEEMNLQCNIDFNNIKGVTPEGWEKCSSVIQYDVETRKLWTELQRPYGNQSSFLRHLILLEKYFRNGDLILAQNATTHAANYSDSVQSRLRAYDNVVNDAPRRSEPAINLIEFRRKPTMNGKSLLKTNNDIDKDGKKVMPPPISKPKPKEKAKSKPLPPELIAINTPNAQGRKAIQNVLHNIQQLVKGVSASDPTEVAAAPLPPPKFEPPKEKKETPKVDTPKKVRTTSKPWRPTLMPITQENMAKIAREPTQVAVDGRHLPSLVQVMSSGKRYHITLQDYNKMCIMRREKLQQIQDGEKKRPSTEDTTVVTEIQPSAMLGNGGTVVQNIIVEEKPQEKKEIPELSQIGANAATILKNVGLKNITIAPIPSKTATVTSQTVTTPLVSSPSLLVSTPIKIPQLCPSVSITSEILTPNSLTGQMIMPKIPKSLTVIPQTVVTSLSQTVVTSLPQNVVVASSPAQNNP